MEPEENYYNISYPQQYTINSSGKKRRGGTIDRYFKTLKTDGRRSSIQATLRRIQPLCQDIYTCMVNDGLLRHSVPCPSEEEIQEYGQQKAYINIWLKFLLVIDNNADITPWTKVNLCIIGQDPYPFGQADGIAFSVKETYKYEPSMNTLKEKLFKGFRGTDLTPLAKNGMMCMNSSLTKFVFKSTNNVYNANHFKEENTKYRLKWNLVVDSILTDVIKYNVDNNRFHVISCGYYARKLIERVYNNGLDTVYNLVHSNRLLFFHHPSPKCTSEPEEKTIYSSSCSSRNSFKVFVGSFALWKTHSLFCDNLYGRENTNDIFRLKDVK